MINITRDVVAGATLLGALAFSASGYAATHYTFDTQYNGSAISSIGGTDPIGVVLEDGDSFTYTVSAEAGEFWTVDETLSYFPFLAFTVEESAERTGDMSLSLYLGGVLQQPALVQNGIYNAYVHMGTNSVSLDAGLMFDQIVLDYVLLSTVPEAPSIVSVSTTISDYSIGGYVPGGFDAGISYSGVSSVPVPAAAWLFGSALLGLAGIKRRKA